MIKTVIFDMDGVIVDTEPVHSYAYFKHYKELNIEVSEEQYTKYTGKSTKNVYQLLKDEFQLTEDVEQMVQRKRSIFNDAFDTNPDICMIDGVHQLIQNLYENGFELILASSASKVTIDRVFRRFNLFQYFSHLVSGEDFKNSKPNPQIFIYAAQLSKNLPEECIVIEDSTNGVKAAKSADLYCIGYNSFHSKQQNLSLANWIVNDFNAIDANFFRGLIK